ncbi:MAG: hypothetical protein ACTSRZ_04230 [Promethearchaeota archaeon]
MNSSKNMEKINDNEKIVNNKIKKSANEKKSIAEWIEEVISNFKRNSVLNNAEIKNNFYEGVLIGYIFCSLCIVLLSTSFVFFVLGLEDLNLIIAISIIPASLLFFIISFVGIKTKLISSFIGSYANSFLSATAALLYMFGISDQSTPSIILLSVYSLTTVFIIINLIFLFFEENNVKLNKDMENEKDEEKIEKIGEESDKIEIVDEKNKKKLNIEQNNPLTLKWIGAGGILAFLGAGYAITYSITGFLFLLGIFYLFLPIAIYERFGRLNASATVQNSNMEEKEAPRIIFENYVKCKIQRKFLIAKILMFIIPIILFSYFSYSFPFSFLGLSILIFAGIVFFVIALDYKVKGVLIKNLQFIMLSNNLGSILMLILLNLAYYLFFLLDPSFLTNLFLNLMSCSFFCPIFFSLFDELFKFKIEVQAYRFPKISRIRLFGWIFLVLLLVIGAGFAGHELKYIIRDNAQYLPFVFAIIGILGFISILYVFIAKRMNRILEWKSLNIKSKVWRWRYKKIKRKLEKRRKKENRMIEKTKQKKSNLDSGKLKRKSKSESKGKIKFSFESKLKVIKASGLILLVVFPFYIGVLFTNSHFYVRIELDHPMYTVDGDLVDSVILKQRSGIILLNYPNTTGNGTIHDELIRKGKSIRLGGYFYEIGDLSVSEAIEWIGNNCDVFSLGMCSLDPSNISFTPENITTIKSINPLIKFYYMAFATTLYENSSAESTGPEWKNKHYPHVKFNSTMHNWTLKLKDGTEAFGIRRKPNNPNAHIMDLGNEDWADYFAWIYKNRSLLFHADGVAIDEVMWQGYWDTNIKDLRDYSSIEEITQTCYDWLQRVHQKIGLEVITQAFWDEAQHYQDGIWGEKAFSSSFQYGGPVDDRPSDVFYENMTWQERVENIVKHGALNRSYIWATWFDPNSKSSLEYAIATYLMGKPNNCRTVVFHPQPVLDGGYPDNICGYSISNVKKYVEIYKKYFDLELGDALEPMQLVEGDGGSVWQRTFENGIVLVNPYHAYLPGFE